uniref:ZF-HD dimerization-type domain-containing protein n=1 Tax=Solanum lycopersicum TaxID=4081 RepID=A0A3Q7HBF3_SOLLC
MKVEDHSFSNCSVENEEQTPLLENNPENKIVISKIDIKFTSNIDNIMIQFMSNKKMNLKSLPSGDMLIIYVISLKNHATNFGEYSVDGCREFMEKGDDGTKEEYICANCGRFRSFHGMNSQSFYIHGILRSRFFYPHVNPHGGGNVPIIFNPC